MPDPGRPPEVSGLTAGELERTRRELAASLALVRPDSVARGPILAHLAAIDAELNQRRRTADPRIRAMPATCELAPGTPDVPRTRE